MNKLRLGTQVTLAMIAAAALLTACGRGEDGSSSDDIRIAIVTRNFTNPYWDALRDGAVAEGEKQGVTVDVQAGSSETDAEGENAKIATMANQNYDCFGVVPVNATNVITPLVPVARDDIPIINLDTRIDPEASEEAGVSYASFIGSDNVRAGEVAGDAMLEALNGSGEVAILQGIPGEQNGINRDKGFSDTVEGKLDIVQRTPADYERSKGLQVTEAILKANPNLDGIFAANDTMGLGAVQAVKNAGKQGEVTIISVDGIEEALTAVKNGDLYGTVTQYPYAEGQLAVQGCMALAQGTDIPERVVSPIALIDKHNVDKQIAAFPKPFTEYKNPLDDLIK